MKKIFLIAIVCGLAMLVNAVPAYRGWQTYTQADGSTIEVQLFGDEFYHYMINRDGKEVRERENGMFEVVGNAPTAQQVRARRAQGQARRQRKDVGLKPNLAPKGIVILVNFADTAMQAEHTHEVFDELCNSDSCTVNKNRGIDYPSAAEYFASQSNGQYHPQFDVFGPVTLSREYAFYGQNDPDNYDNDKYATDAVIEACLLANRQFPELNFADYDSDEDGFVDFVYVMYAGKGEANGGDKNTIWPHNWEIIYHVYPFNEQGRYDPIFGTRASCCYTEDSIMIDSVMLNNYAMSAELDGRGRLGGIGTLCHEFGHVMGLPDFYDTEYGVNYKNSLTPNEWNVMDGGSYNGGGHCPPNYDPWEKYFMGWMTPQNLGNNARWLRLKPNGTEGYKAYQINTSGKQQGPTDEGLCYFIENRQQHGWDTYVPDSGMVIWKVDFDAMAWMMNSPNNTAYKPRYTLVIPSGTQIGYGTGGQNVWPYAHKDSWGGVSGKPLLKITRDGNDITLFSVEEVTNYQVQWIVDGEVISSREYALDGSEDIEMPSAPDNCEGATFIGWTEHGDWCSPFYQPDDLFTEISGKVESVATYYAVFEE